MTTNLEASSTKLIKVFYDSQGKLLPYNGDYKEFIDHVAVKFELPEEAKDTLIFLDAEGAEIEEDVFELYISQGEDNRRSPAVYIKPPVPAPIPDSNEKPQDHEYETSRNGYHVIVKPYTIPESFPFYLKTVGYISAAAGFLIGVLSFVYLLGSIGFGHVVFDNCASTLSLSDWWQCKLKEIGNNTSQANDYFDQEDFKEKGYVGSGNVSSLTTAASKNQKLGFEVGSLTLKRKSMLRAQNQSRIPEHGLSELACDSLAKELSACLLAFLFAIVQFTVAAIIFKEWHKRWIVSLAIGSHVFLGVMYVIVFVLVNNVQSNWKCSIPPDAWIYSPLHATFHYDILESDFPTANFTSNYGQLVPRILRTPSYCRRLKTEVSRIKFIVLTFLAVVMTDAIFCFGCSIFLFAYLFWAIMEQEKSHHRDRDRLKGETPAAEGDRTSSSQRVPVFIAPENTLGPLCSVLLVTGAVLVAFSTCFMVLYFPLSLTCASGSSAKSKNSSFRLDNEDSRISRGDKAFRLDNLCRILSPIFVTSLLSIGLGVGQIVASCKIRKNLKEEWVLEVLLGTYFVVLILSVIVFFMVGPTTSSNKCNTSFENLRNSSYNSNRKMIVRSVSGNSSARFYDTGQRQVIPSPPSFQVVIEDPQGLTVAGFLFFAVMYLTQYGNLAMSFVNIIHSITASTYLATAMVTPST